jgi:hypothetical protein
MFDRIEATGQTFSRQSRAGRCVFTTPIFLPHSFQDYLYNKNELSGWKGPDMLLVLTEEFEVDLDTCARRCVFVCVCVVFSNGLGQISHTSHTGDDWRLFIHLQHYFMLRFPRCACDTKKRKIHCDDYNDTEQNGQWTWKDRRESVHDRCQIAVRHFEWSMSYSTTANAQTENEPTSPNDRPRPHHWANLLYIHQ